MNSHNMAAIMDASCRFAMHDFLSKTLSSNMTTRRIRLLVEKKRPNPTLGRFYFYLKFACVYILIYIHFILITFIKLFPKINCGWFPMNWNQDGCSNGHHQSVCTCGHSNLVIYHPNSSKFHILTTFIKILCISEYGFVRWTIINIVAKTDIPFSLRALSSPLSELDCSNYPYYYYYHYFVIQCDKTSKNVTKQLLHVLLHTAKSLAHIEKSDQLSAPLRLIRVFVVRIEKA